VLALKTDIIKNFKTIDPRVFTTVMRQMGFTAAACYRSAGEKLVLILKTEQEFPLDWPPVVACNLYYTPQAEENAPSGWLRTSEFQTDRNQWKKSVYLYFPEQTTTEDKIVFAVTCSPGKRLKTGELDGVLEALGSRIRGWLSRENELTEIHEHYLRDQVAEIDNDVRSLVDHELRTPLSSMSGYLSLLRDHSVVGDPETQREYWDIVDRKIVQVIDAIDRLSITLHGKKKSSQQLVLGEINVRHVVNELSSDLLATASDHVSEDLAKKVNIQITQDEHVDCIVDAEQKMFRWATWEVLKNAIVYSKSGKVEVAVYTVNDMVVIDVIDDGAGVSPGTEELIFLRFFQEPGKHRLRKGKRGLGLGLYLARQIVQKHMGELLYIRTKGTTVFRFIWPGLKVVRNISEKRGA
jgi:signal transduction histidine kinase